MWKSGIFPAKLQSDSANTFKFNLPPPILVSSQIEYCWLGGGGESAKSVTVYYVHIPMVTNTESSGVSQPLPQVFIDSSGLVKNTFLPPLVLPQIEY